MTAQGGILSMVMFLKKKLMNSYGSKEEKKSQSSGEVEND